MRHEMRDKQIPPLLFVQEWAKSLKNKSNVKCNFFETASDVPDLRKLNSEDKNFIIFDDLFLERQNKCYCYYMYIRGRHSNVDCFYLLQNYFKLPRQTIEKTLTLFAFFLKILKTFIISIMIMWVRICLGKSVENFVVSVVKNRIVSLSST